MAHLLRDLLPKIAFTDPRIHIAPDIPEEKIEKVIDKYASDVDPDDIVVLIDDSIFGNASEGMLITESEIIIKVAFDGRLVIKFNDIENIEIQKAKLFINGRKVFSPIAPDKTTVSAIYEALREYIAKVGHETEDKGESMSQNLIAGQNCQIKGENVKVSIAADNDADFSAFRLYSDGKTRHDEDFIFYGQRNIPDHTISLSMSEKSAEFEISLDRLPTDIQKVAFSVTSDFPNISSISHITLRLTQADDEAYVCEVDTSGRDESALILGELYRHSGKWKFRFINQGFRDGLKALAEFYGVDIAVEEKSGAAQSKKQTVNLSKVTLTKQSPKIDLEKHSLPAGEFKINLNWNQIISKRPKSLSGLFGGKHDSIDLDLGAYVRLKDGKQTIIQALGDAFGSLRKFPYVQLMGDDRTGSQADGEWIYINGSKFGEIAEIVIYTFIYEGVPNWSSTDGIVTIDIPGHPKIETHLSGSNNSLAMCAIARISNIDGNLIIERLDQYFHGHKDMDEAFGWGFRWTAGSK